MTCTVLALWWLVLGAGVSVYRPEVIALGAVALALTAGWAWSQSRPVPIVPPREAGPVPAPPARLPGKPESRFFWWLKVAVLIFPAAAAVGTLAARTEGGDLRRIAAIQEAGAEVAQGRIVEVHRLEALDSRIPVVDGDVTVEVPLRSPGGGIVGKGRVEVVDGFLGRQADLVAAERFGRPLGDPGASAAAVPVLYAPTAPELGGYVNKRDDLGRYLETGSVFALVPPNTGGKIVLACGGGALLLWGLALLPRRRVNAAAATLREDASGGAALPAVRARITAARRDDHTSLGDEDGTVRVTSGRGLLFALEDGSEVLIDAGTNRKIGLFAARAGDRPGWLIGARNWRLIRNRQPVVFVTDEGEGAWLRMDREDFERVIAPAAPVQPDPERRTVLSPALSALLPGAVWPSFGGLSLSYGLVVLVLTVPMPWVASLGVTALSTALAVAAPLVMTRRDDELAARAGRWEVHETRDPELGPA
ncbi:hypothetical protein OHA37_12155 [Streptomyces sp. NBC_00335]|uniref:hypothetical protein n=1 Tax=unclassified Streptomyces TaxID=2593676 RepID=UPI002252A2AD|nr:MULTISPECIES: hypothetical protein [unclassified Streptomyces]MCX5404633.1 hypothetical protein [Streptomyces sp. NBC_00086]